MTTTHENQGRLRQKLVHELKELAAIFLFLALFFCAFTTYRRILMREVGLSYYHYGFAVIKALILAKVIMIGQYARLGRIFDDRPLIVPTLYKVVVFSLLTILFEMAEHFLGGLIHGHGVGGFRAEPGDEDQVEQPVEDHSQRHAEGRRHHQARLAHRLGVVHAVHYEEHFL